MKTRRSAMLELSDDLQKLAHRYGDFRDAITQACYAAAEDTEDFEDKSLTQRYRYLANSVANAAIEEPKFDRNRIEE